MRPGHSPRPQGPTGAFSIVNPWLKKMRQVDTPRRAMRWAAVIGDVLHGTCLLCLCAGGILEVHLHLVIYIYYIYGNSLYNI